MNPSRPRKASSTIFTEDRVSHARSNVERFDWAREQREEVCEEADAYLESYGGPEGLWRSVTTQALPRSISVSWKHRVGSPVTGSTLYEEYGHYPWEANALEDPNAWTVTDPTSGYTFPTNNFHAYYQSGLNDRHEFVPDLADDELLVNERYPERGDHWGVDDGFGWENDDGQMFTFIAYYNHWFRWRELIDAVDVLRDAFLLSGDRRFSRAGTVLLDRIADIYPEMDIGIWTDHDNIWNSHGTTGQGKIGGCIWETGVVETLITAYDAFFPAQDDPAIVRLLDKQTRTYKLGEKSTVQAIRANIENGILREVLPAVKRGQIRGNFGHHQAALATSAVVLDEPDGYTADAIDFLFRDGELIHEDDGSYWGSYMVSGGNVRTELVDVIDRDGHANESPGYNSIMLSGIRKIADVLDDCPRYEGERLYDDIKVRRMHAARIPLVLLNQYMPHIGDTGNTGDPGVDIDLDAMIDAYDRYGDTRYAQIAHLLAGGEDQQLQQNVFTKHPNRTARDIKDTITREGELDLPSTHHPGVGFTALRPENSEDPDTFWLTYGRNGADAGGSSHNHRDTLNMGVLGSGLNLAPDLGYPEMADRWPKRDEWTTQTISHNTVMVDGENQHPVWVGTPHGFGHTKRVQWVDVEAPQAYPQTDSYRRQTISITVDDTNSYAVDLFCVAGGDEHVFSFHGGEGLVKTEGLELEAQSGGTYAGRDVPEPGYGEDTEYNKSVGNGWNYLTDVERDTNPASSFSIEWDVVDTWDVHDTDRDISLRLSMLGPFTDVAVANGEPPQKPGNPEVLRYLLCRRSGPDLSSRFLSVIEPYEGNRFIEEIADLPVVSAEDTAESARAVRVELSDGRTDFIAFADDHTTTHVIDDRFRMTGKLAYIAERAGSPTYAYLAEGTQLEMDDRTLIERNRPNLVGEVVDFTRGLSHHNEIVATVDVTGSPQDLVGEWLSVATDGERNGAYEIRGVNIVGDHVTFDIGDRTLVRGHIDQGNPEAGFQYNIETGAKLTIPMTATWSAAKLE